MSNPAQQGVLVVSVDIATQQGGLSLKAHRALRGSIESALEVFQRREITATWALADTDTRELTEPIRAAGHELALLAGGEARRRATLAESLIPRALRAQAAGTPLRTLVCRGAAPLEHAQLLAKYGIAAVAPRASVDAPQRRGWFSRLRGAVATSPGPGPRAIRYGLWEIPTTAQVTARSGAGRVRRAVAEAAAGLVHTAVDLSELEAGRRGLRPLVRLLESADELRSAGDLRIETLAGVAARLTRPRPLVAPARSILRPAA